MGRKMLFAFGMTAAIVGGGCSGNGESAPNSIAHATTEVIAAPNKSVPPNPDQVLQPLTHCEAAESGWQAVPVNMNASLIAEKLGVSEDRVRHGSAGPAVCAESIQLSLISSNQAAVEISGYDSTCLVFGIGEDPSKVTATKKILALCPAPGQTA
jgi:hypothetical protein